ncbi:unnamed protein product [Adineta steineri]|uniref:Uncharacterized protein n=1 Tax=Adineta steineri TaxID=433720 RepID=A0A819DUU3_9BILA|nr:unnamed protein product [Adineta steineri]
MGLWLKKELFKELTGTQEKTKERSFQAPFTIKAHTLLHTYLHRLDTLILFYFYYNDIAVQFSAMGHTAGLCN